MNKVIIISLECTGDNAVIQAAIEEFKRAIEHHSSLPEPPVPSPAVVLGPGGDFTREVVLERVKRGDKAWMTEHELESIRLANVIKSATDSELSEAFAGAVLDASPNTLRRMRSMASRFPTQRDAVMHGPLKRTIALRIEAIRRQDATRVVPVDASEPARGME